MLIQYYIDTTKHYSSSAIERGRKQVDSERKNYNVLLLCKVT